MVFIIKMYSFLASVQIHLGGTGFKLGVFIVQSQMRRPAIVEGFILEWLGFTFKSMLSH